MTGAQNPVIQETNVASGLQEEKRMIRCVLYDVYV